jgi:hypothetical protein
VLDWRPRRILLDINVVQDAFLNINHFYYPEWHAHIVGLNTELRVSASQPEGFIQMEVPKGRYRVILELKQGFAEKLGKAISLGSLIIMTAGFTYFGSRWWVLELVVKSRKTC